MPRLTWEHPVHGEEKVVYGDKTYADAEKKVNYEAAGIEWRVNRKASRGRTLNIKSCYAAPPSSRC